MVTTAIAPRAGRACLMALLCGLPQLAAFAGTPLLIWPIDPVIGPGQQATALWLENQGSEAVTLQVRVFGWSQPQGEDEFLPQQSVLPSPPIATVAPGTRQLVRLIATRPPPPGTEQPFRIFIDELPAAAPAPSPATSAPPPAGAAGGSVNLQLRYAVPLFVFGAGAVPPTARSRDGTGAPEAGALAPRLAWKVLLDKGQPTLLLRNTGNAHARVTAAEWHLPDGRPMQVLNPGLLGYVMPGAAMRFSIDKPPPAGTTLRALLNGRPADIPRAPD